MADTPSPCRECPFRKRALPGYVGGHNDIMEITDLIDADQKFPCHMQVSQLQGEPDLEDDDVNLDDLDRMSYEQACHEADHCTGALQFMNATFKRSRDPVIAKLQDAAGKNDEVFASRPECFVHHGSDRWAKQFKQMPKVQRDAITQMLKGKSDARKTRKVATRRRQ